MIPHRGLRNEIAGTEIRARVAACRRRLRGTRSEQKSAALPTPAEESSYSRESFLDDDSAMRESLLISSKNSEALANGNGKFEMLPAVGLQEAGIT